MCVSSGSRLRAGREEGKGHRLRHFPSAFSRFVIDFFFCEEEDEEDKRRWGVTCFSFICNLFFSLFGFTFSFDLNFS